MTISNIQCKVQKYEAFVNDVLKEDLRQVDLKLQEITAEINDLVQQKHTLKILTDPKLHPDGFKTQVNIGCNFFMEAAVKDTSNLLFNIGLNHFLELSLTDANKYLDIRIKAFERKAEELRHKSAATKGHIKLMLLGIAEMKNQR